MGLTVGLDVAQEFGEEGLDARAAGQPRQVFRRHVRPFLPSGDLFLVAGDDLRPVQDRGLHEPGDLVLAEQVAAGRCADLFARGRLPQDLREQLVDGLLDPAKDGLALDRPGGPRTADIPSDEGIRGVAVH